MRRRAFIAGLGGALIHPMCASAARAQRPMPVIGFLSTDATVTSDVLGFFREGLASAGYTEGRNVAIEFRSAEGQYQKLPSILSELVGRKVAVLVVGGAVTGALAAKEAATTVPTVFLIGGDPVRWGLVASFARPGVNITGVTISVSELIPKRVELLRELVPNAALGLLTNPNNPNTELEVKKLTEIAQTDGWKLKVVNVTKEQELEDAFNEIAMSGVGGVAFGSDALFANWRQQLASLALRYKLPAILSSRQFALDGGLLAYGPRVDEVFRMVGVYTARILDGAKPADIPVWAPTTFDLIVNLKTAKTIGLTVPPSILARADEVME